MTGEEAVLAWKERHTASDDAVWEFREVIHDALRSGPIDVVLEIGAHRGDSLRVWCDVFSPELTIGIEYEDSPRTREGLEPLIASGTHIVWGNSQDYDTWSQVKGILRDRPVDFLYIDGDHMYEIVRRDFYMYAPLVRRGGIVVLDDAIQMRSPTVEVYRLVPEIQTKHRTKIVAAKGDYVLVEPGSSTKMIVWM